MRHNTSAEANRSSANNKFSTEFFSSYQLNAQFLYSITIYTLHYNPQHVSSSTLLIFRRTNCIITASGIVTLCKQPYSMPVESGLKNQISRKPIQWEPSCSKRKNIQTYGRNEDNNRFPKFCKRA